MTGVSGRFTSLDVYAGAGGQALGLEQAGFDPVMLIDDDAHACETLRLNRPEWDVRRMDFFDFLGHEHPQVLDVDLVAGGPPRMSFSRAGDRRAPESDAKDHWKAAVWAALEVGARAVMLENVPDLVTSPKSRTLRDFTEDELGHAGFVCSWNVLDAQFFGVPQRREHGVLVALKGEAADRFAWPAPGRPAATLGEALGPSMASGGWTQAEEWAKAADRIAPTIVGGSKKRGGADLGPTGSKRSWARLGVNGGSIGDAPPGPDFKMAWDVDPHDAQACKALPKLTVPQVTMLQAFPAWWKLCGGKTARYRQVGHALPPPLATALGGAIVTALDGIAHRA